MKKISIILLTIAVISFVPIAHVEAEAIAIDAESGILLEEKSGRVLWEKNSNAKLPMASTTKIMTAIVAIEYGNLKDMVTIGPNSPYVEGTSLYLKENDKILLEDLVYGLILRSGNDAAHAIAEHIAGSEENFVELMNQKAAVIGASDTEFSNPHGLHDEQHYTTANDLAYITSI